MEIQDIKGWTYGFMEKNETECIEYMIALQSVALDILEEGDYQLAASLYYEIICGIEKLCVLDKDYYEPSLYIVLFTVAKIEAFHLENREKAIDLLKQACAVAKKCTDFDRADADIAEKDLELMQNFLAKLTAGIPMLDLKSKDGENFWTLTNSSAFSNVQLDNTISGIGCLVLILVLAGLCILYSVVMSSTPNF